MKKKFNHTKSVSIIQNYKYYLQQIKDSEVDCKNSIHLLLSLKNKNSDISYCPLLTILKISQCENQVFSKKINLLSEKKNNLLIKNAFCFKIKIT